MIKVLIFAGLSLFHPLHVSVTELEFDQRDGEFEVTMRIFMDDLENAVRKSTGNDAIVLTGDTSGKDDLMKAYILGKLSVQVDGKGKTVQYLGHETQGDAFIFYMIIEQSEAWREVVVQNEILQELYDDQSNLINVIAGEKVKSLRLTKTKPSGKLVF